MSCVGVASIISGVRRTSMSKLNGSIMRDDGLILVQDVFDGWLVGAPKSVLIPYYQRGYRWEEGEVLQLLQDFLSFADFDKGHYFLQLLVYRRHGDRYCIVDGQQRLTTMVILNAVLNNKDALSELEDYFYYERYDGRDVGSSIDSVYVKRAEEVIKSWFEENPDSIDRVREVMLRGAFLRYELPPLLAGASDEENERAFQEECETFDRMNLWKVEATDAELVKSKLLSRGVDESEKDVSDRALQWESIERRLSEEAFWGMIAPRSVRYESDRMGLLLVYSGLGLGVQDSARGVKLFKQYVDCCRRLSSCSENRKVIWDGVIRVFEKLEKIYADVTLCNQIGWYLHRRDTFSKDEDQQLRSFAELFSKDLEQIKNDVRVEFAKVWDSFSVQINGVVDVWGVDKTPVLVDFLLLVNVAWCSFQQRRYDFSRHRAVEEWSIEHIHAKRQGKMDRRLFDALPLKNADSREILWKKYCQCGEEDNSNWLRENLSEEANYPLVDEDHTLGNLALLPKDTNSSLLNGGFDAKLGQILDWSLFGGGEAYWVPPMTWAVFVKTIHHDPYPYWSVADRKEYLQMMRKVVGTCQSV